MSLKSPSRLRIKFRAPCRTLCKKQFHMKVLAVDTATGSCSVAILEKESLLAEVTLVSNRTHSEHLMGMITEAIRLAGLTISDVDGFAVTRGPGSFTGIRIGLSTVKGLATASNKPVVGVSSLKALASQCYAPSILICPLIDARRGEVYYASYRYQEGHLLQLNSEQVAPPGNVMPGLHEPCLFVGNGVVPYREVIRLRLGQLALFAPVSQSVIRAATVGFLGMKRLWDGDMGDLVRLAPRYIRPSDAEINLAKNSFNRE